MKKWYNYGRVNGSDEFRIMLEDGCIPLILYRGFWNPRRAAYRMYPHTVFIPGDYRFDPFYLPMSDVSAKAKRKRP